MPRLWNPIIVPAETFRKIRDRLGLTQTDLAAALNVTKRTIIRWEQDGAKLDRWAYRERDRYKLLQPLAKRAHVRLPKKDR